MKKRKLSVLILLLLLLTGCNKETTLTVQFIGNCESAYCLPESRTVESGTRLAQPAFPAREGYVFTGWFTDPEAQHPYDFSNPVKEPLTLYAGWLEENDPAAALTGEDIERFHQEIENILVCAADAASQSDPDHTDSPALAADAVERYVQDLMEQGTVTYCSRQGNGVYMEFASQLTYLYIAPEEGTSASGEHVNVLCVEPFHSDPQWSENGYSDITKTCRDSLRKFYLAEDEEVATYFYGSVEDNSDLIDIQCLPESEVLLWDGHGHFTGEESVLVTAIKYAALRDAINYRLVRQKTITLCHINNENYVALRPQFIRKYFLLDDALVYLSTCRSLQNDTLAQAFLDTGASVVFGNAGNEDVITRYTQDMIWLIIDYMSGVEDGIPYTASEALAKAQEEMAESVASLGFPYHNKCFLIKNGNYLEFNTYVDYAGDGDYTLSAGLDITLKMAQTVDSETLEVTLVVKNQDAVEVKSRHITLRKDEPQTVRIWGIHPGTYTLSILEGGTPQQQLEGITISDHHYLDLGEYEVEKTPPAPVSDACHTHAPSYELNSGIQYYIPRVNLPGDLAAAVNNTIYQDLIGYVRKDISYDRGMNYLWAQKDSLISILVLTGEDYNTALSQFFVYNVSADTGERLPNSAMWETFGLTETEYYDRLTELVDAYYRSLNTASTSDSYLQYLQNQMERSHSAENLEAAMPYIDISGDLCVMIKLYSPAGPDYQYYLYNLTGTAAPKRPEYTLHELSTCVNTDNSQSPYGQYLENGCYLPYLEAGEVAEGYAIVDINGDGVDELIIDTGRKTQEFHKHLIYRINDRNQITYMSTIYSYHCVRYAPELGALGYVYPRGSMETFYHCSTMENNIMYESHTLYANHYEQIFTVTQFDSLGKEIASYDHAKDMYDSILAAFRDLSWADMP